MTAPTVTVIGLATKAGSVAAMVDADEGHGWTPQATRLSTLTDTLTDSAGNPNVGKAFACIQYDFGVASRVPLFLVQTETAYALSDCMLIGSDAPATVATNIVQAGDVLLGLYPRHQITAGAILATAMKTQNISKRYLRMVFHATGALMTPDGTQTEEGGSSDKSVWFDNAGAGSWTIPADLVSRGTSDILVEGWGGGASGGESATANDGGDTTCTVSRISADFLAEGGSKSAITTPNTNGTPAPGGAASGDGTNGDGGYNANITGGAGGLPTPFTGNSGYSGKGGDAPNGGAGGPGVFNGFGAPGTVPGFVAGVNGAAPGAGGSGRSVFFPGAGGQIHKYPGGASGGYFRRRLLIGYDWEPGDVITFNIGAGGVSTQVNGRGANGRIKFSW